MWCLSRVTGLFPWALCLQGGSCGMCQPALPLKAEEQALSGPPPRACPPICVDTAYFLTSAEGRKAAMNVCAFVCWGPCPLFWALPACRGHSSIAVLLRAPVAAAL